MEQYLSGLLTGSLVGWVLGQLWQSWNDHSLLRAVLGHNPIGDTVEEEDSGTDSITQMFEEEIKSRDHLLVKQDSGTDSITQMFEEEIKSRDPDHLLVKQGGGYMTFREMGDRGKNLHQSQD